MGGLAETGSNLSHVLFGDCVLLLLFILFSSVSYRISTVLIANVVK